jgi:hypothetical protein
MTTNDSKALWKRRWIITNVLTIIGFVTLAVGLLIWRKGLFGLQDEIVGKLLFLVGIIEMLLLPTLLRRQWRRDDKSKL